VNGRRRLHACAAALAWTTVAACGGGEEAGPSAEPAPADASSSPAGVAWEEASSAPLVSLSANDASVLELHRGWPLVLRAAVLHKDAFEPASGESEPLALAGDAALRVRVVNEAGTEQSWPLHVATPLPAGLVLARDGSAEAAWWLAGDETAALAEGRYALVAELDTTDAASGWQGRAESPAVTLALSVEPTPLPAELARAKRGLALSLLLLRDELGAAGVEVEALLRENPEDLAALEIHADLLAASGREQEALAAYGRALDVFSTRFPDAPEPPAALLAKRHALVTRLLVPE
jgi:hypothetical protein